MARIHSLVFLLFSCFVITIFMSCQSQKTINRKLTVLDSDTSEPIAGAIITHEFLSRPTDLTPKEEALGKTDDKGFIHIKKHVGKRTSDHKLRIAASGYLSFLSYGQYFNIGTGKGTLTAKLERCYYFSVSLKNQNCFDVTDSVWISGIYETPVLYTGCVDETITYNPYDFTYWTKSPTKTFTIKVKRNGITTTFEQTVSMIHKEITSIDIDY